MLALLENSFHWLAFAAAIVTPARAVGILIDQPAPPSSLFRLHIGQPDDAVGQHTSPVPLLLLLDTLVSVTG
jgi:hypothetical protein